MEEEEEDFSFEVEGKKTDCGKDYKNNKDGCKEDKNCEWDNSKKTCVSKMEEDEEDFSIDSSEDYVSEMWKGVLYVATIGGSDFWERCPSVMDWRNSMEDIALRG